MPVLNRTNHTTPVITEHHPRYLAGNEPGTQPLMPRILLTGPNPAMSFMARVPNTKRFTSNQPWHSAPDPDHSGIWLRNAATGLCLLAAAAATVSFTAQYRLIYATRRLAVVAGLEAAIPDAAALVFACLGIALALHGSRAIRPRILNLASVGTSVFMNTIAAAPGWRDLAIWSMPPIAYGLASDTLIGVVRTAITRRQDLILEETTPLAVAAGLVLWLLRLALAPVSTLAGFRAWVLQECPVAPGRRHAPGPWPASSPRPAEVPPPTKTARFLLLVTERHGPLAALPLHAVASIAADLAPQVSLNPGSARAALRKAVLTARNGDPR
jgi:hypothetical protein